VLEDVDVHATRVLAFSVKTRAVSIAPAGSSEAFGVALLDDGDEVMDLTHHSRRARDGQRGMEALGVGADVCDGNGPPEPAPLVDEEITNG